MLWTRKAGVLLTLEDTVEFFNLIDGTKLTPHGADPRAVVITVVLMGRLVGIGSKQLPAGQAVDEGDVYRRSGRLEPAPGRCRFAQGAADLRAVLVEYQDVRCEGVVDIELATRPQRFVIANTCQAMPGFENEHLEAARVAEKGDSGWHIQARDEY